MFPINLTETEYVNPEALLHLQFMPKRQTAYNTAVLLPIFQSTAFLLLEYRRADAEEAFGYYQKVPPLSSCVGLTINNCS